MNYFFLKVKKRSVAEFQYYQSFKVPATQGDFAAVGPFHGKLAETTEFSEGNRSAGKKLKSCSTGCHSGDLKGVKLTGGLSFLLLRFIPLHTTDRLDEFP